MKLVYGLSQLGYFFWPKMHLLIIHVYLGSIQVGYGRCSSGDVAIFIILSRKK